MIAATPEPPYYVVMFTSERTDVDTGYAEAAQRVLALAAQQPGFLGVESARSDGLGITLSYWQSEEAIRAWREQGRANWYAPSPLAWPRWSAPTHSRARAE